MCDLKPVGHSLSGTWILNKVTSRQYMIRVITLEGSQTHPAMGSFLGVQLTYQLSKLQASFQYVTFCLNQQQKQTKNIFFLQPKKPDCHTRIIFYLFLVPLWVGQEYLRRPSWDIEVILLYKIIKQWFKSYCFVSNKG